MFQEKNLSKSSNENQGVSMESSGTAFSSSSCSPCSSRECHRSTQQEPSSMDQTFLERSMRNSAGLKNSDDSRRPICYESLGDPSYASTQSDRQSLDFSNVAKDSIYRDTHSLSVKTSTKEEVKNRTLKQRDSPRLMQLSETAPGGQQERIHIPQKTELGYREAHLKQQPGSVYSEIERRLKDLEFEKSSSKDLRALKLVINAMQAKGLSESKKGADQHSKVSVSKNYSGQTPAGNDHNFRTTKTHKLHNTQPFPTLMKGSNTPRACESPITIMKPAKSVIKSDVSASSAIPLESLSGLQKPQTSHSMYRKRTSTDNRRVKEQTSKVRPREPTYQPLVSKDKKSIKKIEEISTQKTCVQFQQFSSRPLHSPRQNNSNLVKTSGSLSPRLQARNIEREKSSCSYSRLPSSESKKSQRSSANRQYLESVSPRGRLREKPARVQQKNDQLSDISKRKRSLNPSDEISLRSESNVHQKLQISHSTYRKKTSTNNRRVKEETSKKSLQSLNEDVSAKELATVASEHPSPVSVVDASFYQDGMPPSPVSKAPNALKDNVIQPSEHHWNDDFKLIAPKDVLGQSGWNEFSAEVPTVALEIERLIFEDLIDEVVGGRCIQE